MTRIQLRHDTATNWTIANPILAEGEAGVETDTNKFKIGDGVTNWNNLAYQGNGGGGGGDLSNYYTKTETDSLLEEKANDFVVENPLTLKTPTTSSISFDTYGKGEVNYNYETGEYYYGFAEDRTMFQIIIDIPEDINIDVYNDYWKIGDTSLSFSRTQPNTSANNNVFEIYANNGTDNVMVSRLWYGSGSYRAGSGTTKVSNPFRDGIAKHTANSTTVNSGSGSGDIGAGYNTNIVSGSRLSRIILFCMCQCSESWANGFTSASWGNYWSDSSGARLKSLKLYTSADDTEGIELIRYSVNKTTINLNIDTSLSIQNNLLGVNTSEYYTQTQVDTLLNNKVNLNFDNMNPSQTAKDTIISWGMPDYSAGIDIGTADKYEALVDGYYVGRTVVNTGTAGTARMIINIYNNSDSIMCSVSNSGYDPTVGNSKYASITLPVPKGYKISVNGVQGTLAFSNFYPMKGAN